MSVDEKEIQMPKNSVLSEGSKLLHRQGKCNMCGKCCKAIFINLSHTNVKENAEENLKRNKNCSEKSIRENAYKNDLVFIYMNWIPISKEMAFKINPHLKTWEQGDLGKRLITNGSFWACKCLRDNKCTVHEHKPDVCANYPYYGKNLPKDELFYSPNCGYKVDAGR